MAKISHSATPYGLKTKKSTHYSALQHNNVQHEDGGHATVWTWGHVTVSHSTTPWNRRTHYSADMRTRYSMDMRTRYSVSQHYTVWLEDRKVHITVSHRTTPYDLKTEKGTHYSVSQHNTPCDQMTEKYTLQYLNAPHRTTWRQRKVHIIVSHSTIHRVTRWQKSTHYSAPQHHTMRHEDRKWYTLQFSQNHIVRPEDRERYYYSASQHHTMRHEDRERYTLQCLTAPHRTTGGQRKKHTLQCLTWQGQVRTRDRCFQVFDVPLFLLASTLKICFQKYPTPVCMFTHCTFDSSAFSAEETLISGIVLSHCGKGCDGGWGIDVYIDINEYIEQMAIDS